MPTGAVCVSAWTAHACPTPLQRLISRLRSGVEAGIAVDAIRGIEFTQATQANAVFASLPPGIADRLRDRARFYDWDASIREVCSLDTQPE